MRFAYMFRTLCCMRQFILIILPLLITSSYIFSMEFYVERCLQHAKEKLEMRDRKKKNLAFLLTVKQLLDASNNSENPDILEAVKSLFGEHMALQELDQRSLIEASCLC